MPMRKIESAPSPEDPIRLPRRTRRPLVEFAVPVLAVAAGAMLFMSVLNLIGTNDVFAYAKAATLAASAVMVAFAVNTLAIERGAPLAAKGYAGAGLASVGSILAVGAGLFAATYSGLTLKDTAELQLQQHGATLAAYVGQRNAAAAEAGRIVPAIRATEADLQAKLACEIAASCISGRAGGGNGTVARAVKEHADRAAAIGQQIEAGAAARLQVAGRLDAALAEYQKIAAAADLDLTERRVKLAALDAGIRQSVGELGEALPLALLGAYSDELPSGVAIPGRPEAETRLNGILARHGQSLAAVVAGIDAEKTAAPAFPGRTGVSDTFAHIGHFLPVAAIAAVTELVLPLILWLYAFWGLHWTAFTREQTAQRPADPAAPDHGKPASPDEETPASDPRRPYRRRNGHAGDQPDFGH